MVFVMVRLAAMLSKKRTILLIAIRQGFFSREVLRGVLSVQHESSDWEVWVVPLIHDKRHLESCLESREVAGVITRGLGAELMDTLHERGIPVVAIRGPHEIEGVELNGPHVDDEAIGGKAGGEFARLNLDYWGFVHWEGVAWSEARRRSFQTYADSQDVQLDVFVVPEAKRHDWQGVLEIKDWLARLPKPCGILACNDEAGVDVLHACKLAGLNVPGEVAVIGVDNDRLLCESTVPALSSIDLHAEEVGRAAARQLDEMLGSGEGVSVQKHIGQSIMVVRESSHEIDRYLLVYQRALDYIRAHALTGPSVASVADACGVSKRGLERSFEKHAVSSPAEMIREQRTAGILRLLKNQSLGLNNLAHQAGFSDAAGLSNFIKRMTGKPPGAFRE